MVEVLGFDYDVANCQASLNEFVVAYRRSELLEFKGEVCVLHLPRKRLA